MLPGALVAGRFEIVRLAESGGMGSVYLASDHETGEQVALKVLRAQSEGLSQRLSREGRILAELRHPGIVRHIAHGATAQGELYLAMEWLEGETLGQRLARGPLTAAESVSVADCIAQALAVSHARGIVHRDIKPSNVFLVDGRVDSVKVLDFGIARARVEMVAVTVPGMLIGTVGYMAPEQARATGEVDARADVWSLGCVLFRCLTGWMPFSGEDATAVLLRIVLEAAPRVRDHVPSIPPALDELVARMLSKEADGRPRDGAAVALALESIGPMPATSAPSPGGRIERLTHEEQRLVSVVVARDPRWVPQEEQPSETLVAIRGAVASLGPRIQRLADGSIVAAITGGSAATDLAAQAARLAFEVRALLPDAQIAVATGRAVVEEKLPVGEVIDRVLRLLRQGAGSAPERPGARPIRVDDVTAALLEGRFLLTPSPSGAELRGERGDGGVRTLLGKPTPCVGRDAELATLVGVVTEGALDCVARAVLVTAAEGMGKSRLREELVRRAREALPSLGVWMARAGEVGAGSPYSLLAQMIRGALGIVDGQPLEARRRTLAERVAEHFSGADAARVTEFVGELVGAPFPDADSVLLKAARQDPVLSGDQMRRACEELLDAICAKGPLLLVLEDLHWGDRPSVAFVDRVLLALRERPLVVVAFARPDVDDVFPDVWRLRPLTRIALAELSRRASERLVRAALGGDVPPETVAFIVDRASGHPFYLEEIIRAFAEGRGDDLPPTVLAMVQARLEGLSDEPRRILRAASVFGQSFWRGSVRALLGADDRTTMGWDWLDELCRSELVTRRPDTRFPGEEELAFRHVLVRAAAYATLTEEDRVLGHRLAGRWLEDHGEPDAVVLAEHFERGGDAPSAIRWYRRAAEQAFEGDDLAAALRLAARAVGCGALGETLGALRVLEAEAHRWRGQQADALAAAVEAMSVSDPGGALWCQAAGEVAMAAGRVGAPQKAAEIARALLDQQQPADATAFALAATRTASILIDDGQHDAAEALLDRIERGLAPEVLADPIVAGRYFFARSVEAGQKGDVAGQLDAARRTIQATDASGDARGGAISRITLARAFLELGAVEEATRALAAATAGAARQGLHHVTLLARCEEGVLDALRGRFDEAVRTERSAVEDFVAQRNLRMEGVARLRLSTILLDKGDAGEASVEAARALELASARDSLRARTLAAVAETDVASGRVEAALAHAREAALLVDELGLVRDAEVVAGLALARALQAAGQAGLARDAALRVEAIVRARASRIADPVLRESFLTQVPENARAIALASEMSRPASANEAPES